MNLFDLERFRDDFENKQYVIICENFDERLAATLALIKMGYDAGGREKKERNDFEYPNIFYNGCHSIGYTRSNENKFRYTITSDDLCELVNGKTCQMVAPTQEELQSFLTRGR